MSTEERVVHPDPGLAQSCDCLDRMRTTTSVVRSRKRKPEWSSSARAAINEKAESAAVHHRSQLA